MYGFRSTEKAALQEIGPRYMLKLRSLIAGLPAVKAFSEPSTKLEFDEFDDVETNSLKAKAKANCLQRKSKKAEDKEGMEDGDSESQVMKTTRPPRVDECQWQ